ETRSLALGDLNGDGALDIVVGNLCDPSQVYLNDGASLPTFVAARTLRVGTNNRDTTRSVAVGDLNGDGVLEVIAGNSNDRCAVNLNRGGEDRIYTPAHPIQSGNQPPHISIQRKNHAPLYATSEITESQLITFTYLITDADNDRVREISVTFSLDGGSN